MSWLRGAAAFVLSMGLASCSLDYGQTSLAATEDIPLMSFTNIRQTSVVATKPRYTYESQSSEVFPEKNQVTLRSFHFEEYDATGNVSNTGHVASGLIRTDTSDATLTPPFSLHAAQEGVDLTITGTPTQTLAWQNAQRTLVSSPDMKISLRKADGSVLSAQSLTLNLLEKRVDLSGDVEGTWSEKTATHETNTPVPAPSR